MNSPNMIKSLGTSFLLSPQYLPAFYYNIPSPFGDILLIWQDIDSPRVNRIYLPKEGVSQISQAKSDFYLLEQWRKKVPLPQHIELILQLILNMLSGRPVLPPTNIIKDSLSHLKIPEFRQKVLLMEATIPFGFISSYKELAKVCGRQLSFRAVAGSLSHNPLPLLIPCHRIVASNGYLAGYQGGIAMKRFLLENEGVPIRSNKVIIEKAKFWDFSINYQR